MVDTSDHLGCNSWVPGAGQESSNQVDLLCLVQNSLTKGDGLMLELLRRCQLVPITQGKTTDSSIAGHESNLGEREFESNIFRFLSISDVRLEIPLGVLRNLRNHKTARDIWDPVRELDAIRRIVDVLRHRAVGDPVGRHFT